jgi:hypothetical protein
VSQHPFSGNVIIPSVTGLVFQNFLRSVICAILVIKIIHTILDKLETQHDTTTTTTTTTSSSSSSSSSNSSSNSSGTA